MSVSFLSARRRHPSDMIRLDGTEPSGGRNPVDFCFVSSGLAFGLGFFLSLEIPARFFSFPIILFFCVGYSARFSFFLFMVALFKDEGRKEN